MSIMLCDTQKKLNLTDCFYYQQYGEGKFWQRCPKNTEHTKQNVSHGNENVY